MCSAFGRRPRCPSGRVGLTTQPFVHRPSVGAIRPALSRLTPPRLPRPAVEHTELGQHDLGPPAQAFGPAPRPFTVTVPCPTCGLRAQLRVYPALAGPDVIGFSCREQTSRDHTAPTRGQLVDLLHSCAVQAALAALR